MKLKIINATLPLLLAAAVPTAWADPYAGWTVGNRTNGYGTVLRTQDSGTNWTRQGAGQIADVNLYGVAAVNASTAWAVGDPQGGYATIYRTTDGGAAWVRKGSLTNVPNTELSKVFAISAGEAWAVGMGAILHTSDGGDSWTNRIPTAYKSISFQGICSPDGVNVWATGGSYNGCATILKSGDGGLTWMQQTNGDVSLADHLLGISAVNASTAWTVGGNLGGGYVVLRTSDGGTTWTTNYTFGFGDANEVSAVNATTVWVACDGQILRSTNRGKDWDAPSSPPFTMGISAVSSKEAWAVVNGESTRSGSILHTRDGGTTWITQGISGETLAPLWTVSFARGDKFTFAAFGDVRGDGINSPSDPIVSTPVMQAFAKAMQADGVELAIVNGDLMLGQTDPTYTGMNTNITLTEMFGIYTNVMTNFTGRGISIYPVRGNHEVSWSNGPSPTEAWTETIGQFLPRNGPPGEEGFTYSFIHSNALFLCLDQYGGTNGGPNTGPSINLPWVEQQLKTNTQKHIFVMGHAACFQSMMPCLSTNTNARTAFWECMQTNGVRLYFCGHDHYYLRSTASISNSPPMQQVVVGACTEALIFWPGFYFEQGTNGVSIQTEAYFGLEPYQAFYRLLSATTNVVVTGLTRQGYLNWTNYGAPEDLVVERNIDLNYSYWGACLRRSSPENGRPIKITNLQPTYGYVLVEVNGSQVHCYYKTTSDMKTWEIADEFSYEIP